MLLLTPPLHGISMSLAEEFLPEPIPLPAYDNLRHVFDRQDVYRYGRKAHRDSEAAVVESEFAALLGRKFALAVNSGGSAILLALLAAGVRPGDDVLLPAFTFTAVTSAVVLAGARPVFVDCRENYCVDPIDLEKKLLGGARFLLLSYMRGHVADLDRIIALCERQGVKLIEDCAHSLGTKWRGRQTGVFGVASCFSFQDKLINAGEGGFVATDDPDLYMRAVIMSGCYDELWRTHASRPETANAFEGRLPQFSMRMSNIVAAIIRPQLAEIEERVATYQHLLGPIRERLARNAAFRLPQLDSNARFVSDTLQFQVLSLPEPELEGYLQRVRAQGVPLMGFGVGERNDRSYWNWRYVSEPALDGLRARHFLLRTFDVRLRTTMSGATATRIADVLEAGLSGYGANA